MNKQRDPTRGAAEKSAADAIPDVRGQRGVDHLHRLEARVLNAVEQSLSPTEQDRNEVEHELVDRAGCKRLAHG